MDGVEKLASMCVCCVDRVRELAGAAVGKLWARGDVCMRESVGVRGGVAPSMDTLLGGVPVNRGATTA